MPFLNRSINETAARRVFAWSSLGSEAIGNIRTAAQTTHRELWNGTETPEELAEALGEYGQEAISLHYGSVLFLALVAAVENGSTQASAAAAAALAVLTEGSGTEDAIPGANAAAAVVASLTPVRAIIPGPDGTITIAPES